MRWREGRLVEATVLSTLGGACRLRAGADLRVTRDGRPARTTRPEPGIVEIDTAPGATYVVRSRSTSSRGVCTVTPKRLPGG